LFTLEQIAARRHITMKAAEKAKLEAEAAKLDPGPEVDALRKKIRQLDTGFPYERVAFLARAAATKARTEVNHSH
jgi:hypothetical protein